MFFKTGENKSVKKKNIFDQENGAHHWEKYVGCAKSLNKNGTKGKHIINPATIGTYKSVSFFFLGRNAKSPKILNNTNTKPIVCSKIKSTEKIVKYVAFFLLGNSYILIE